MAEILYVSKPVEPPWNDGTKTMVRDLVCALTRHEPVVLGTRAGSFVPPRGRVERLFPRAAGHALSIADGARVLARLVLGPRVPLWHFFFQPSVRTVRVARSAARARRAAVVHTVTSAPPPDLDPRRLAFADRVVVLSRATERRFAQAGVRGLVRIAPAAAPRSVPDEEARRRVRTELGIPADSPLVVFPGDLERGEGARLAIDALAVLPDATLALAWRDKGGSSRAAESALRARAARLGVSSRVRWIGETDRIVGLLGAADVVVLPSRDLGAKVDLPIVLLEAMWQARPVIVARGSSAEDLAEHGGAVAVEPDRDALVAVLRAWLDDAEARAMAGGRARAAAEAWHHPARAAARHEALYDELLG